MDSMISSISSYQGWGGTFVTLVAPPGAHAFSAGSYIAEASNQIYMVQGTTIGSATPIVSGIPTGEENSTMTKDINGFTTYMQGLASEWGRNTTAAGLMVSKGVSYTNSVALQENVITEVLNTTTVSGALTLLQVPAGTPVNTPGVKSQLISVISDPNVSSLLFLVGVFAVLFDIYHPTIVLSVAGIALMALSLLGLGIFGAPLVAILLMIVGAAFIFLEVKTQHGVSALIGVVVFAVGFLLVFQSPAPVAAPSPSQPPQGNFFTIPTLSYASAGGHSRGRHLGQPLPGLGEETAPGAAEPLRPQQEDRKRRKDGVRPEGRWRGCCHDRIGRVDGHLVAGHPEGSLGKG